MDFVTRAFAALKMQPIFENHSRDGTRFGCKGRGQITFAKLDEAFQDFESQRARKKATQGTADELNVIKLGIAIAKVRRGM